MIPTSLEIWTLEAIYELLQRGVFESDCFDFKERLPHKNDQAAKLRLTKSCCAFANTSGGFLVFGVKDDKGLNSQERIVGLEASDDFPNDFGNFPATAEPSIEWSFRNPPIKVANNKFIHVVQVAMSHRKPHGVSDEGRWWVCKRTSKGTEAMSLAEIRQAFLDTGRRTGDLAWLKSEMGRIRDLAKDLNVQISAGNVNLDLLLSRFDVGQVRALSLTLHGELDNGSLLVRNLQGLIADCMKIDSVLVPLSHYAILPRDRSYSRTGKDPLSEIRNTINNVASAASQIFEELKRVLQ